MSTTPPNLSGVLSETTHILAAHPLHFLSLTLLFLLPFTLSLSPLLLLLSSTSTPLLLLLLSFSASSLLLLLSVSTITFSASHALHSRPLTLTSSFSSLSLTFPYLFSASFFPLLYINYHISIMFPFPSIPLHHPYGPYLHAIHAFVSAILAQALLCLLTVWILVGAVVVVEGGRGRSALLRSQELVMQSGAKWTAGWLVFLFGFVGLLLIVACAYERRIVLMVCLGFFYAFMLLNLIVGSTVLYVQCKAAKGEEIISGEYVCLPVDDDDQSKE